MVRGIVNSKIGFGDLILLLRYFFKLKVSTHPKVMDKMFLLNSSLSGAALSNLKVTPDHGAMLRDIYPYIHAGWHMNKKRWISIYEDEDLDPDLVIDLVHSS